MFENLWGLLWTQLQQNQFLSGGALLGVCGILFAYFRTLPKHIYWFCRKRLIVQIDILDKDSAFNWIVQWLSKHPYSKKCRLVSVKTSNIVIPGNRSEKVEGASKKVILSPAPGPHFFWYKHRLVLLWRHRTEGSDLKSGHLGVQERFHITIFSRNIQLITDLLAEAQAAANPKDEKLIKIYKTDYDQWAIIRKQDKRSLESVILRDKHEETLLKDVETFLGAKEWYIQNGVPYRRGYLLYGQPGNGKTSVIAAIASKLDLNICVLNLSSSYLDDEILLHLFSEVPENSLVLIEDIDCVFVQRETDQKRITFSGLLNAIDGITATEGRIVFMTTNHKEVLDPALIRPGRCDLEVEFTNATVEQAEKLCLRFCPGDTDLAQKFGIHYGDKDVSMAMLQGLLIKHKDTPEGLFNEV